MLERRECDGGSDRSDRGSRPAMRGAGDGRRADPLQGVGEAVPRQVAAAVPMVHGGVSRRRVDNGGERLPSLDESRTAGRGPRISSSRRTARPRRGAASFGRSGASARGRQGRPRDTHRARHAAETGRSRPCRATAARTRRGSGAPRSEDERRPRLHRLDRLGRGGRIGEQSQPDRRATRGGRVHRARSPQARARRADTTNARRARASGQIDRGERQPQRGGDELHGLLGALVAWANRAYHANLIEIRNRRGAEWCPSLQPADEAARAARENRAYFPGRPRRHDTHLGRLIRRPARETVRLRKSKSPRLIGRPGSDAAIRLVAGLACSRHRTPDRRLREPGRGRDGDGRSPYSLHEAF